jgi:outer membrane protein OmpA-like peptidoglycan-associated protein
MKALINVFFALVISSNFINAQAPYKYSFDNTNVINLYIDEGFDSLDKITSASNSSEFILTETGINTKYSEIGSGLFKGKVIMVSSKKIGGLGNGVDKNTNQPYTDLFCLDIDPSGELKRPLLFSRILNTKGNEGQITFTEDEKTMYFTRSTRENSKNYQLYKTNLQEGSYGNWVNIEMLEISSENHSIENPFVHNNRLYFSSNMQGSIGGFDLFVAEIKANGTLGIPQNLGSNINTTEDEKYPFVSSDNKHLYFSSKGHNSIGGFDVFISRIVNNKFKISRNLGVGVNTPYNEIAFFLKDDYQGYLSSDKVGGKGSFDIYKFDKDDISQTLQGYALDGSTQIPLPNTLIILTDEEGREIGRQFTNENGQYNFPVIPFDSYSIDTSKDGFIDNIFSFEADKNTDFTYNKNLELEPTSATIIEINDKLVIDIENIYFDFNKSIIKEESTISLSKIVNVLNANPEMNIEINAHTDNVGKKKYNQILSEKRAAAAMQFIINKGVSKERLVSNGYGETQPLFDCDNNCTKSQDQANRRIEFVIIN